MARALRFAGGDVREVELHGLSRSREVVDGQHRLASERPTDIGDVRSAGYIATWIELLKADKRAFFTACNRASKAAEYLRGLALTEPTANAA